MDDFIHQIINNLNEEQREHCHNINDMKLKVYLRDELSEGVSYWRAYITALERYMEERLEEMEELLDHKDAQIHDLQEMSDELQFNDMINNQ